MTCILGSPTYCAVDVVSEPQARDFDAEFFCKDGWQASKACEARCQSSCGICDLAVHVYSTCAWYSSENTKSSNCCFTCRSCTWAMRRRIVEAMEQIYTTGAFSFFFLSSDKQLLQPGLNLRPYALQQDALLTTEPTQ